MPGKIYVYIKNIESGETRLLELQKASEVLGVSKSTILRHLDDATPIKGWIVNESQNKTN